MLTKQKKSVERETAVKVGAFIKPSDRYCSYLATVMFMYTRRVLWISEKKKHALFNETDFILKENFKLFY